MTPPEHGGRLNAAAARYGIARADWLDLSTGINPAGWPVPALASEVWRRLPEDDDALPTAVLAHYGRPGLPVAGSQAALAALPRLRAPGRVGERAQGAASGDTATGRRDRAPTRSPDRPSGWVTERWRGRSRAGR